MMNALGRNVGRAALVAATFALVAAVPVSAQEVADAAMRGDLAAVTALIKKKADVNVAQGDGMTALLWAAELGNLEIAQALVKARANQKATTSIGNYTVLHLASRAGSAPLVKLFLAGGADANAVTTSSGVTPLHLAASAGSAETIRLLLAAGAKPNAREPEWGQTPLMFAAAFNRADAVSALIAGGADVNLVTRTVVLRDATALDQTVSRRRTEILNAGRTDTTVRVEPTIAQMQAAIAASRELYRAAQVDLDSVAPEKPDTTGLDPDEPPPQTGLVSALGGFNALHHAAREGSVEAMRALIDAGAPLDVQTGGDKSTALVLATVNGFFDAAMVLIAKGANPNIVSEAGTSPLYATLERRWANRTRYPQPIVVDYQKAGHVEVLEALLKAGANPNVTLNRHLYYMTYTGCGNANCGLEQVSGATPFWRAAYATDVEAMRVLAKYGADPMIPTKRAQGGGRGGGGGGGRGGAGGAAAAGRGGAAGAAGAVAAGRGGGGGRGGGRGGGGGGGGGGAAAGRAGAAGAMAGAATAVATGGTTTGRDSAATRTPPAGGADVGLQPTGQANAPVPTDGSAVYPIHAAAGVGYGQGFAGNSHRHAPDGWLPSVKYLVEELKIDVNLRDINGYTPLHHAAARGDIELIKYLVSKGADVKAVSNRGQTTADMANGPVSRISPYPDAVKLLESLGSANNHRCASCE